MRMNCGGTILNRHHWVYDHDDFRICKKCGTCTIQYHTMYGSVWMASSFNQYKSKLDKLVEEEVETDKRARKSRLQSLKYLKGKQEN